MEWMLWFTEIELFPAMDRFEVDELEMFADTLEILPIVCTDDILVGCEIEEDELDIDAELPTDWIGFEGVTGDVQPKNNKPTTKKTINFFIKGLCR